MTCCIELDTPASIMREGNDYYEKDTDIFAEIIEASGTEFQNAELFLKALWWRYRNYIIGACDTEFWVQGMADRLNMVGQRWDEIFDRMLDTDLTDLTDRAYNRVIKRTAIPETDGDVRTIRRTGTVQDSGTNTGTVTTTDTPTGSNVHKMEHESLPQTLTDDTKYLDARQTDTETPGVVNTNLRTDNLASGNTRTDNLTDTDTYKPNTQDTENYEEFDTLNAVTFDSMVKAFPNVFIDFTDEFAEYFVDRWY